MSPIVVMQLSALTSRNNSATCKWPASDAKCKTVFEEDDDEDDENDEADADHEGDSDKDDDNGPPLVIPPGY